MYDYPIEIDEFSSGDELLASDCNVYGLVIMDIFMQGKELILTDGTQIPVSRTYRKEIEKVFPKE